MSGSFVHQAANLTRWGHEDVDEARGEIYEALGDYAFIEVWGSQLLLADYMRPDITKGGIKTLGTTQNEDVFQGVIGMVLAIGPVAMDNLDPARFGKRPPELGDFVYCRPQDTVMCHIRGPGARRRMRKIEIMEFEYDKDGRETGSHATGRYREEAIREFEGWPCRWVFMRDLYGRVKFPHMIV